MENGYIYDVHRPGMKHFGRIAMIFSAFYLIVMSVVLASAVERIVFSVFAAVFVGAIILYYRWQFNQPAHPLRLDKRGITHRGMLKRYGIVHIPWKEIVEIDHFRGDRGVGDFMRIAIRPGSFRDGLKTKRAVIGFGRDIDILMAFDASPEEIVTQADAMLHKYSEASGAGQA